MGGPGAQYWGIEELVAKTGDLVCDLSTVPNSFNSSHRLTQMAVHFTRTWCTKLRVIRPHDHLGFCAQGSFKARVGQQSPAGNANNEVETSSHLTTHT